MAPHRVRQAARELLEAITAWPDSGERWSEADLAILRNIASWRIPPAEIVDVGRKVVRFRRSGSYQDLTNAIGELEDVIEAGEE